jgi:predicted ribosomally synthesized peptide with SipW-like signal peptide
MTDDKQDVPKLYNLSRRRVLGGLGAIGLASAGAGLGTSAFFSDQETFENNRLVAGTLDMKVDWEEHYYDGSQGEDFVRVAGSDEDADYVLPAMENNQFIPDARPIELVFAGANDEEKQDSKDALWDATSIEAFPDSDDDGIQDEFSDDDACTILADVGANDEGLNPMVFERTMNADTWDAENEQPLPLINLDDVKPGDFGEVTFSFHLCDNPGYVWVNGQLVSEDEGIITEPEAEDPEELEGVVELADYIMTRMWYDPNGNNQRDLVVGELDIMMALDTSGSISSSEMANFEAGINAFVDELPTDGSIQIGSLDFSGDLANLVPLTNPSSYSPILPSSGSGATVMPAAIDVADQVLADGRAAADKLIIVFTDGGPNYDNIEYGLSTYTAPRGSPDTTGFSLDDTDDGYDGGALDSSVSGSEQDETALVAQSVRGLGTTIAVVNIGDDPNANLAGTGRNLFDFLADEIASQNRYYEVGVDDLAAVADSLAAALILPDEVFFQGSLREALQVLAGNDGRGVPLDGDLITPFDELTDAEADADRDCFVGAGTTHFVAFQWWLPIDHGNQVQGDSVTFDLGFYTEQCRHNDGAGMVPEDVDEIVEDAPA